jgi:sulfofructose kinase
MAPRRPSRPSARPPSRSSARPSSSRSSRGRSTAKAPARKLSKPDPARSGSAKIRKASAANPAASVPEGVIVGVGLATCDLLCVSPRFDERRIELSVFSMQGGGAAGNALATLAALGAKTRFFGRLGDDHFGRFIVSGLTEVGVNTSMCLVDPHKLSPVSIVEVDEFSRRRKIRFTPGDAAPPQPRDIPPRLLQGAAMLYIDGYHPALQAAIAEKARKKGIPVLLNAGNLSGGMGELLALADIVIGSERFASEFAPSDEIEKSLREITRVGPRIAVLTLGNEGAVGLEGDKLVQQEPLDVFVADTTGAGDVFCGAFAYAHLAGFSLEEALPFANAAAGLSCRSLGARAGLPHRDEVLSAWRNGQA